MVDECCRALVVYLMLKLCARCVGALRMVDHPQEEIANVLDIVFLKCHLLIKPGASLFCGILHEFSFFPLRQLPLWELRVQ